MEAAPWLLLGLIVSGLIKEWLPAELLRRWLGGRGVWPVLKAAVIGTPLPLCSCSVIPAAVTLRRSGASKGSTVSFLVSTPENGADSIALSYALLGPFMMIVRPVAAIFSAVAAGLLTFVLVRDDDAGTADQGEACAQEKPCCSGGGYAPSAADADGGTLLAKLSRAYGFAVNDLFADIAGWLALGLVLAALMNALVPADAMAQWGSGVLAMLAVMAIGVPMYICATASTPVAAAMLLAGVSPGTALVFLLAGPATNLATIGVVRRELGGRALAAYLLGVCGGALAMGLATDAVVSATGITVSPSAMGQHELVPAWLALGCLAVLALLTMRWLYRLRRSRTQA